MRDKETALNWQIVLFSSCFQKAKVLRSIEDFPNFAVRLCIAMNSARHSGGREKTVFSSNGALR